MQGQRFAGEDRFLSTLCPNAGAPLCLSPTRTGFDFPRAGVFAPPLFFGTDYPFKSPMQQLHAYWRMEYIEAPRYPAAMKRPFTELPALGDDRAALIVHRSPLSYLILNRFPYNPGHLLAVPFREVTELEQLNPAERADLFEEIILGKQILAAALKPEGFNVGFNLGAAVAGGSIAHLHGHIVPRWNGDNNFMPVIGQTRILPQSLDATWEKLAAAATQLGTTSGGAPKGARSPD
jgi:ATP adenylyltransferase